MNKDTLEGNWKQLKGHVKARWGKLTEDDLKIANGNADILCGKIQERYGLAQEEAEKELEEFLASDQAVGKHLAQQTLCAEAARSSGRLFFTPG